MARPRRATQSIRSWHFVGRFMGLTAAKPARPQKDPLKEILSAPGHARKFPHQARLTRSIPEKRRTALRVAVKDFDLALQDLVVATQQMDVFWGGLGGDRRKIEERGRDALARLDGALFACVGLEKMTLFDEAVHARITAARRLGDNAFFDALGLAIRRTTTPHAAAKLDTARKAAALLDAGFRWQDAYDRLSEENEFGEQGIEPKEFYKLLQRHGVIPREKRQAVRRKGGKKN